MADPDPFASLFSGHWFGINGRTERELARVLYDMYARLDILERSNQLRHGSIIDGSLDVYPKITEPVPTEPQTPSLSIGQQYDGTVVAAPLTGPLPPIPSKPEVSAGLRTINVYWDGFYEAYYDAVGNVIDQQVVAPMDFARVEIHISTDPDFTAETADTLVGTYETPRGGNTMVPAPTVGDTYTVKLVARSLSGKRSTPSLGTDITTEDVQFSDGLSPSESPTPICIPAYQQINMTWEAVPNADPIVYRIFGSNTDPTVPVVDGNLLGEVAGTSFVVKLISLVPPTEVPTDSDSYFRIVARDADGDAAPSDVVAARANNITDGIAPSTSPTPTVTSGIRSVMLRWPQTPNADPVRYRVHGSKTAGFTPDDPTTLIAVTYGTALTVTTLPSGTSPDVDTTEDVYFKIIAEDDDGISGDIGDEASGRATQITGPDVAAETVTAAHIVAGEIIGTLFAGEVILGTRISTGQIDTTVGSPTFGQIVGTRIDLDPTGFSVSHPTSGTLVRFPTNPVETSYVRARLETSDIRVKGRASFESTNNEVINGAGFNLNVGITPPASSPLMSVDWNTVTLEQTAVSAPTGSLGTWSFSADRVQAMCRSVDGYWMVVESAPYEISTTGCRIWRFNDSGSIVHDGSGQDWVTDIVFGSGIIKGVWEHAAEPGRAGFAFVDSSLTQLNVRMRLASGTWATKGIPVSYAKITGATSIAVSWHEATGNIIMARPNSTDASKMDVNRYFDEGGGTGGYLGIAPGSRTSAANFTDGNSVNRGLIQHAGFDIDSSQRFAFFQSTVGRIKVSNSNNASFLLSQTFDCPPGVKAIGFGAGAFWSLCSDGKMYQHTNWYWSDGLDYVHSAATWYDDDTAGTVVPPNVDGRHESTPSTVSTIALTKRARLRVTLPTVPDFGGVDDPNKWRFYAARWTSSSPGTSSLVYQTEGGSPSADTVVTFTSLGTSDPKRPPTTNQFPTGTPGYIRGMGKALYGTREPFRVDGSGAGQWDNLLPPGSITMFARTTALTGYTLPEITPGWLRCHGEVVSRTQYAALFAAIGTQFNTGGELSTQFRLPNFQGRVPVGVDTTQAEFDVLGETGGEKSHVLTAAESGLRDHVHPSAMFVMGNTGTGTGAIAHTRTDGHSYGSANANFSGTLSGGVQNSGNYDAMVGHNNLQPYLTVTYIIKT